MAKLDQMSPKLRARLAGFFWLLVFLTGSLALFVGPSAEAAFAATNVIASVCYAIATILIYGLLKPVNKLISLVAATASLSGCVIGLFGLSRLIGVRDLVFFGIHCFLVGLLIFRSTFLPRALGALLIFAGMGWLTFAYAPLANYLSPYNFLPGMLGEGLLILWLLAVGVNEQKWQEQGRNSFQV